jgi:hypothetical protein
MMGTAGVAKYVTLILGEKILTFVISTIFISVLCIYGNREVMGPSQ